MAKKISRTPRRKSEDELVDEMSIFDHFEKPAEQEAKPKEGPTSEELLAKLNALQEQLDAQERDFARSSSMRPTHQEPVVQLGEEPKLDLTNLPDPVTHATEYAQAILQRGRDYDKRQSAYEQRKTQANTPQQMGDPEALYGDFTEQFPEYAAEDTRMRFVTAEVTGKLAKRGIDVQRYMYTRPEAFFSDLTKEYDKTFGSPREDDGSEAHVQVEEVAPRRQRKARTQVEDEGDDGRTAGIVSQTERGPATQQQARLGKPDGMIDELQQIQRKSGYF
jgi:hypothetical protein